MHAGRLVPGYVSRHWWAVGMKACLPFCWKIYIGSMICSVSGSLTLSRLWLVFGNEPILRWLLTMDYWWWILLMRLLQTETPLEDCWGLCTRKVLFRLSGSFWYFQGIFLWPASVVRSIVSIAVVRCSMKAACIACTVRVEVHFIKHYTHETCSDVYIHGK